MSSIEYVANSNINEKYDLGELEIKDVDDFKIDASMLFPETHNKCIDRVKKSVYKFQELLL